jgi:hypothetical protein
MISQKTCGKASERAVWGSISVLAEWARCRMIFRHNRLRLNQRFREWWLKGGNWTAKVPFQVKV